MAAAYGIYAAQGGTARVVGTTIESRAGGSGDDRLTPGIKMVAVTGGRVTNTTITQGDVGILLACTP